MSHAQSLPARLLPDQTVRHLRFARARRAWKSAGITFVHIPKNAGVSISRALYGRTLGHYSAAQISRRDPHLLTHTYSFAVLRDPLERAISAYRFATAGSTRDMAVANPHLYRTETFADFDTFVGSWLAHQDLTAVDPVFRTQASYVTAARHIGVDDLFWLGDLQSLAAALRRRGHPGLALSHSNATDKSTAVKCSPASEQAIKRIYHDDYELIGAQPW